MYQQMIREDLAKLGFAGVNPRWVEGWLRCREGTLDTLSRLDFRREVQIAVQCIHSCPPSTSEALADSYGIREVRGAA